MKDFWIVYFCESGIFIDSVGWHYERDYKTGIYEVESGRVNGDSDVIITVYLRVNDGVSADEVEKTLSIKNEREE